MENKETKDVIVSARIKPTQYAQLMRIAKAYAPPSQEPKISWVVYEAITQYLNNGK